MINSYIQFRDNQKGRILWHALQQNKATQQYVYIVTSSARIRAFEAPLRLFANVYHVLD